MYKQMPSYNILVSLVLTLSMWSFICKYKVWFQIHTVSEYCGEEWQNISVHCRFYWEIHLRVCAWHLLRGQYWAILSWGMVFIDTLPRDSIGQYCPEDRGVPQNIPRRSMWTLNSPLPLPLDSPLILIIFSHVELIFSSKSLHEQISNRKYQLCYRDNNFKTIPDPKFPKGL